MLVVGEEDGFGICKRILAFAEEIGFLKEDLSENGNGICGGTNCLITMV